MAQPIYERFVSHISKIEKSSLELAFSKEDSESLKNIFPDIIRLSKISDFPTEIEFFLQKIYGITNYQKYSSEPSLSNFFISIKESDYDKVKKLLSLTNILNNGFETTSKWFNDIRSSYELIVKSEYLFKQQKAQLFSELDEVCKAYLTLCETVQGIKLKSYNGNIFHFGAKRFVCQDGDIKNGLFSMGEFIDLYMKPYILIAEYKNQLSELRE
jgi:hypothetical protein